MYPEIDRGVAAVQVQVAAALAMIIIAVVVKYRGPPRGGGDGMALRVQLMMAVVAV